MKNSKRRKPQEKRQNTRPPAANHGQRNRLWLYGSHTVTAALANPDRKKYRLAVTSSDHGLPAEDLEIEIMERQNLERILPPGAVHQGTALLVSPLPETTLNQILARTDNNSVIVVLDQATDPQNIGAVLRSAAAFGADAVVVPDRHTPDATGALAKAASGALDRVPFIRITNLARTLKELKAADYWCAGLAADGDQTLAEAKLTGRTALVLGAEGTGLRRLTRNSCDFLIRIPIQGNVDSLNLSAATAISLYELKRASV